MDEKSKRSTLDELCAEPAYQFLVSTLVNGSCILVGAGSSVRAGMPGWGKLLDELDAAAIAAGKPVDVATPHALLRAGAYENALGRDGVGRVIAKVFGRPERAVLHTTFHSQLVSLPSRALLTTNYDLVLESAVSACGQPPLSFDWSDSDARSRFANALVDRPLVTPVVHLHGSVRSPSDVVLGLDSYDRMYERDNASKMALATLVTVSRLVFIGFSFDDETFGELLKRVRALHDPKQTKHVAILPSKGQEEDKRRSEELRGLYRVQPLFYDASNNRVQLDQLIDRLVTDVQARVAADQEIVRRTIIASLNVPPEDQLRLMRESGSDSSRSSGIGQIAQPKSLVTGGPRVALDDEIDVIAKLMRSGKPAKAIEEFTRLEHDHAAEIDDRLRYRVRANTGHAWLEVGDDQKAAACYAVAGDLRPNDRDGGWLRCLAKELCGQIADAAACADVVVREFPDCDNAWAVWVRTHSETLTPREIRRQVPRKLRRDADVAATISTVYRASGDWRGAIAYGRATLRGAPDRPRAQSHLAVALLECAARCSTFRMPRGLVPKDEGPIHEAIGLLDNAISELLKGEPTRFLGVCLVNRAAAFRLLGEQDKADVDISEAFRLVPADPIVLGKYISLLDRRKESDRIIQLLTSPAAIEVAQEAKFFLAIAYLRRHVVGDGEMAIATLQNLVATAPADLIGYSDALGLLIDRLLASGRSKDALDQLRAVPAGRISSALLNARIATVEATEDGKLTPTDATRQAIRKSGVEAMAGEPIDRVEIAQRAAEIGEYQTAADLLLTVVDPIQLNQTTSLLLECLHHANRDMALIEACRSLRKAGVESRSVLAYEVNTLVSNGEDFAAMDLLRGWLSRHGDDRKALLEFGRLALRTGRQSEACFDVSRLPTVAEVDSEEMGSGITEYLRAGNRQADARRYAYDLYRRFPGSEVIRLALIWSDMNFKVDGDAERPKKVDDNTAFTLALQPTGTLQDVFVGDAIVLADELLPSDPLVAAAWGHVAGDEIAVGDRIYTLVRADDKIRRRAVDCLASFTQRFPTTDRLVEYSVPEQPRMSTTQGKYLDRCTTCSRRKISIGKDRSRFTAPARPRSRSSRNGSAEAFCR